MDNMENKRERSALYPIMTVEECFDVVGIIDGIGGKVFSISAIAQAMGMSEKTNSFRAKISTLKQYGLVQGTQNTYKLTEIAKRYLYPVEDKERRNSMIEAFLSVTLYKKLVEKYENQALPSQERLSNLLLGKEFGLTKNTKDIATELFLTSLKQLDLVTNGVLILNPEEQKDNEEVAKDLDLARRDVVENKTVTGGQEVKEDRNLVIDKYYNFEIPTMSGSVAKIIIPQSVTKKDLDFIQMYIENMLPVFLNNLRNEEM